MKRWLLIALVLTGAALISALLAWHGVFGELPERVPVHWNIRGEPDHWADRAGLLPYLLIPPGVMAGMILLALVLPWLSPRQFGVESFRATYEYVFLALIVLLGYIHVTLLLTYLQAGIDGIRMMVGGLMLFFALLGNVMGKVKRNFWMGVRTPWTLASEAVWIRTHRVTAWLWTPGGLLLGVAVLAGVPLQWVFVPFLVMVFYPVVYSLVLYKRLEREGKLTDGEPLAASPKG
jgi:uncharacterized membrane protein